MFGELKPRFGSFLVLIGTGVLLIFITSVLGGASKYEFLITGLVIFYLGIRMRITRKPASPGTRFSSLRKMNEKLKKDREKSGNNND